MKSYKKLIFIVALAFLLCAGGIYAYSQKQKTNQNPDTGINEATSSYDPPTEEEKAQAEQHKENLANQPPDGNQPPSPQPTTGNKKQVTPVITVWGQNPDDKSAEINGYVSGIYEDGGTCTLILEKDGQKKTASRKGFKDAQTTTCGLLTIPRSSLSAGTWQATLSYSSAAAQGASQSMSIEIK